MKNQSNSMVNLMSTSVNAFSLVQLSAIVVAAGLVAAAVIPEGDSESQASRYLTTLKRMEKIEQASVKVMASSGKRLCPASGEYYPGEDKFGEPDGSDGDCADSGSIDGVLTPFDDTNVVAGTVPVRALGLPKDYYFDGWARPFTYVVDKRATDQDACVLLTGAGDVEIRATDGGSITDQTMYALISHGPDGHGAFLPGGSTRTNRIDTGSSDADQFNNAGVSGSSDFSPTTFLNEWVKKDTNSTFDDVVWYSEKYKNTCCVGKTCATTVAGAVCTPGDGGFLEYDHGSFDGSGDYVDVGSNASMDNIFNGGGTITAWIKPSGWGEGDYGRIFHKAGDASNLPGYSFFVRGPQKTIGLIRTYTGTDGNWRGSDDTIDTDGNWYHVAVVHNDDAYANDPTFYVNGADAGFFEATGPPSGSKRSDAAQSANIGTRITDREFDGRIRDLRVYNDELTAAEITYVYNYGLTGTNPGTANLVARYGLDEDSGSTAYDLPGATNDGTVTGMTWGHRPFAYFDGSDDYIDLGSPADAAPDYISFSAWVKLDPGGSGIVVSHQSSANKFIRLNATSTTTIAIEYSQNGTPTTADSLTGLDLTNWNHVTGAFAFDGSSMQGVVYAFTGVPVSSGLYEDIKAIAMYMGPPITFDSTKLTIGATYNGTAYSNFFDGKMHDVRIYDKFLTADEARYLFTSGFAGTDPTITNLQGHYRLNESSGTVADDLSANCNDGTAVNTGGGFWNP